jgi:hypothetical protein
VHREAKSAVFAAVVCYVQDLAFACGLVTLHAVDDFAVAKGPFADAKGVEHHLANGLDHEARTNGCWGIELIKNRDAVAVLGQKARSCEPADASTCDCNVESGCDGRTLSGNSKPWTPPIVAYAWLDGTHLHRYNAAMTRIFGITIRIIRPAP